MTDPTKGDSYREWTKEYWQVFHKESLAGDAYHLVKEFKDKGEVLKFLEEYGTERYDVALLVRTHYTEVYYGRRSSGIIGGETHRRVPAEVFIRKG